MDDKVLILDFGSQYTQLIARRIREARVYCEIWPCTVELDKVKEFGAAGVILSGGPASVHASDSFTIDPAIFELGVPVLGICYGQQLMQHLLGGEVVPSNEREYGHATLQIEQTVECPVFHGLSEDKQRVWMSHGDRVERLASGFDVCATSANSPYAGVYNAERNLVGVQFHPEVVHTTNGRQMLENFLFRMCKVKPTWTMANFVQTHTEMIQQQVGDKRVIVGLSGGVDSSVVAGMLFKAIGKQTVAIYVDTGMMRMRETERVREVFEDHFGLELVVVDARQRFLDALKGADEPEQKRAIIREEFVAVFLEEARKIGDVGFLAQGTLYPDVIESSSPFGPSAKIKSHHNVGIEELLGLPLIEPLRELFKDEVRQLGRELGLPEDMVRRHPFPGPGLAIRILGTIEERDLEILRKADAIMIETITEAGLYDQIWQAFCVLLPVRSVGVMGDARTYEQVVAVRCVESVDGMTADWYRMPPDVMQTISSRIINEVAGVNRVVYDVSSKPPATIEWE